MIKKERSVFLALLAVITLMVGAAWAAPIAFDYASTTVYAITNNDDVDYDKSTDAQLPASTDISLWGSATATAFIPNQLTTSAGTFTQSNVITWGSSLTKLGAGKLILTGANTMSADATTTVSEGTLEVSGSGTIGTGALSIANGATFVASKDLTLGNVTVASGGTLITTNKLTTTGTVTLSGTLRIDLAQGGSAVIATPVTVGTLTGATGGTIYVNVTNATLPSADVAILQATTALSSTDIALQTSDSSIQAYWTEKKLYLKKVETTITPLTETFDLNNAKDIKFTLGTTAATEAGKTGFKLKLGDMELKKDTTNGYTLSGNTLTIKQGAFSGLAKKDYTLLGSDSNGTKVFSATITVKDTSTAQIVAINGTVFDHNNPANLAFTLSGNSLDNANKTTFSVRINNQTLVLNTDYTFSGTTLTIKKEYLATLANSTSHTLATYNDGTRLDYITLTVKNTATTPTFDAKYPSDLVFKLTATELSRASAAYASGKGTFTITLISNKATAFENNQSDSGVVLDTANSSIIVRKELLAARPNGEYKLELKDNNVVFATRNFIVKNSDATEGSSSSGCNAGIAPLFGLLLLVPLALRKKR